MPIVRPQNLNECFLQAANFLRQKPIDLPHNVKVRIDARYDASDDVHRSKI